MLSLHKYSVEALSSHRIVNSSLGILLSVISISAIQTSQYRRSEVVWQVISLLDWQHTSVLPLFLLAGIPQRLQNHNDPVRQSITPPSLPENKRVRRNQAECSGGSPPQTRRSTTSPITIMMPRWSPCACSKWMLTYSRYTLSQWIISRLSTFQLIMWRMAGEGLRCRAKTASFPNPRCSGSSSSIGFSIGRNLTPGVTMGFLFLNQIIFQVR